MAGTTKVLIVGGGMTGLGAAWELQSRGIPWVLAEASDRLGGVVRTERTDGFVLDAGPDSFIVTKPWALQLVRELGLEDRLIPVPEANRHTYILNDGRLKSLPEGMFLGIPTRFAPLARSNLFSLQGKLRMARERFVRPRRDGADESIADFVIRRLGREAYENLLGPLLSGIHAGDPARLSIRATFPRLVDMEQQHGSLIRAALHMRASAKRPAGARAAKPSPFRSLRTGMVELVEALTSALPAAALRTGHELTGLTRQASTWTAELGGGETINAKVVLLAIPSHAAAPLVQDLDPELAALLREIRYVSTATLLLGWPRTSVPGDLKATGFLIPARENRRILACTWTSSKFEHRAPDDHVLLRVFFGGARDEAQASMPEATLLQMARDELKDLMGITDEPVLRRVFRYPKSNPQYEVGHLDRIARIREREARLPGLFLVGSAYEGTGLPDTIRQGRDVAARVEGEPMAGLG